MTRITRITRPATASDLLDALREFRPGIEDGDLVFDSCPPPELDGPLRVLHTGARAVLVGRIWYGCDGETGRVVELNPGSPLPDRITLLCVAGDRRWDRIHPAARVELPELFDPYPARGPSRGKIGRP
jgi:hypothetical protein